MLNTLKGLNNFILANKLCIVNFERKSRLFCFQSFKNHLPLIILTNFVFDYLPAFLALVFQNKIVLGVQKGVFQHHFSVAVRLPIPWKFFVQMKRTQAFSAVVSASFWRGRVFLSAKKALKTVVFYNKSHKNFLNKWKIFEKMKARKKNSDAIVRDKELCPKMSSFFCI